MGKTITLTVKANDTIDDVKAKIQDLEGISARKQQLECKIKGRWIQMEGETFVRVYGLDKKDVIVRLFVSKASSTEEAIDAFVSDVEEEEVASSSQAPAYSTQQPALIAEGDRDDSESTSGSGGEVEVFTAVFKLDLPGGEKKVLKTSVVPHDIVWVVLAQAVEEEMNAGISHKLTRVTCQGKVVKRMSRFVDFMYMVLAGDEMKFDVSGKLLGGDMDVRIQFHLLSGCYTDMAW